ncbi:MAG: acyl carrier protein [Kiloniellaceae bacterium]
MRARAFALVKDAVEELNEELEYDSLGSVTDDTPIYGGDDGIDSLSLVTLVVGLEERSEAAFGRRLALADQKAMSMRNSPYRTAGALADFIVERLNASAA